MEIIQERSSPLAAFNRDRSSSVPTFWFGITGRAGQARPIGGIQPGQVKPCPYVLVRDNRGGPVQPGPYMSGLWGWFVERMLGLVWGVGGEIVLGYSGAIMEIIRDNSGPLASLNRDRSSPVPTIWFGITGQAGPARPIHFRPVGLACRNDLKAGLKGWW